MVLKGKQGIYRGKLAGPTRFELATSGVTGRRSIQAELRPRRGSPIIISGLHIFNRFTPVSTFRQGSKEIATLVPSNARDLHHSPQWRDWSEK